MAHHDRIVITGSGFLRSNLAVRQEIAPSVALPSDTFFSSDLSLSVFRSASTPPRNLPYGSYASKRCAFDETTPIHPLSRSSSTANTKDAAGRFAL